MKHDSNSSVTKQNISNTFIWMTALKACRPLAPALKASVFFTFISISYLFLIYFLFLKGTAISHPLSWVYLRLDHIHARAGLLHVATLTGVFTSPPGSVNQAFFSLRSLYFIRFYFSYSLWSHKFNFLLKSELTKQDIAIQLYN